MVSVPEMQELATRHLGQRIELFCPVHHGCPQPEVTWSREGVEVVERSRERGVSTIRMARSGGLVIEDSSKEDDGHYTCSVSNRYGTIHHTIRVETVGGPTIQQNQPGNHTGSATIVVYDA